MPDKTELPYREIPTHAEEYLPGNIVSRLIDGLGFRFYWATEGLTQEDLNYEPSENSRSTFETVQHVYDLSVTILNIANQAPNIRPYEKTSMNFKEYRSQTLINLKQASEAFLGKTEEEIVACKVIFQKGDAKSEYPFWNGINGQFTDAIYHTGQIVSFRRSSGNPVPSGVNVFTGKAKHY